MLPNRPRAELQHQNNKLVNSYNELLEEFSSKDLRHVGNYTLGQLIGKGSFGKVYLAKHNLTNGSKVVLKSSKKDDANLAREIHHHRQFLHPHIARLYEVIVTESLVWLVLEYCPGDEVYNYLVHHGALPVDKVQKIFAQLLGAVAYIHNKSCVHRDLKLENVLLDKHENVKLCDFGFTREYEGKTSYLQTFCGTVCYSAPEMLRGEKYAGEKVDVWSLGIILFALLTGALPFDEDDDQATKAKILKDEQEYPEHIPRDAKNLISKLLAKRPLHRPSLSDILADPFLSEHAPHQQAILKLSRPAPFSSPLEKETLDRMRSAGVNTDQVVENVLAQRCDPLAGWWALLVEKEERKEIRRERKRKDREAEGKVARRLSGASTRLDKIAPALVEVDEEGPALTVSRPPRSRGRQERRNTPQILVTDLPQLPEGPLVKLPGSAPSSSPTEKDLRRSESSSRPLPPPKEAYTKSGNLKLVHSTPDMLLPPNGVPKRRLTRRYQHPFINQLVSLKHWFAETAKRAKSPGKTSPSTSNSKLSPTSSRKDASSRKSVTPPAQNHQRTISQSTAGRRSSFGISVTPPSTAKKLHVADTRKATVSLRRPPIEPRTRHRRESVSPAPLTPHSSYRRSSAGLRGRKSTSSSVSSVRSIHHRHTHSKASSTSSSHSIDTVNTPPGGKSARSSHASVKVLPPTPTGSLHFPSDIRVVRGPLNSNSAAKTLSAAFNELAPTAPALNSPSGGLVYARRKKSAFKGPMLNASLFGLHGGSSSGPGTPGLRSRASSVSDPAVSRTVSSRSREDRRKSQIIEEEEEEENREEEDDDVEEVDSFSPVDLRKGERVHSITVWDDVIATQPVDK